jgi:hypothetical protein
MTHRSCYLDAAAAQVWFAANRNYISFTSPPVQLHEDMISMHGGLDSSLDKSKGVRRSSSGTALAARPSAGAGAGPAAAAAGSCGAAPDAAAAAASSSGAGGDSDTEYDPAHDSSDDGGGGRGGGRGAGRGRGRGRGRWGRGGYTAVAGGSGGVLHNINPKLLEKRCAEFRVCTTARCMLMVGYWLYLCSWLPCVFDLDGAASDGARRVCAPVLLPQAASSVQLLMCICEQTISFPHLGKHGLLLSP